MKVEGKNILAKFLRRWQSLLTLEMLLYGLGASILVYFINQDWTIAILTFIVIAAIVSIFIKPWKPNLQSVGSYLDSKIESAEYSSSLLLSSPDTLSDIAKLQKIKISEQLAGSIKGVQPPNNLNRSALVASLLILAGFLVHQFNLSSYFQTPDGPAASTNTIIFKTKDSANTLTNPPKIMEQVVTIRYPQYTNIKSISSSKMDIKVLEGSSVFWNLKFDSEVNNVLMESMENDYPMTPNEGNYSKSKILRNSGFYNFKFKDTNGRVYSSDLYSIDVFKDKSPKVDIQGLKQFSSFNYNDEKIIQFNSIISDDFGIADAYIIATVSKGTGESVKFREEKLSFNSSITKGLKKLNLSKRINLDDMKLEPGDELYFYVETLDLKEPTRNISRSETYFAAVKDTTSYEFGVEGTLGVDRMPDYFRSQRQLIIDTEKLISQRKELSNKEFKFNSNELGFVQKALRLKYGEFMGVETDSGLDIQTESPDLEPINDNEDPLADYTHDHDSDNEHNLVEDGTQEKDKTSKNPLQEFMHDHGDPEMATQFEESLKAKMHKAMTEMWDAELYLRLYEPQKSLPYQYEALKLIQEIKNHARIYVHRIGFDPPPIKEDKRLTGKLDDIASYRKREDLQEKDKFPKIRESITRLGKLQEKDVLMTEQDQDLFEQAATELSTIAIEFPSKYLRTLQQLKQIIEGLDNSAEIFLEVRQGLLKALPNPEANPIKSNRYLNEIDKLLLKELNVND